MSVDIITEDLTALRNADLAQLAQALNERRTRQLDVRVAARTLRSQFAALDLTSLPPQLNDDGVTDVAGYYTPTPLADSQLASRLGVPGLTGQYLRHLRANDPGLYDTNVNRWLSTMDATLLLRCLTGHDGTSADGAPATVRAVLSSTYGCIDDFDIVVASLAGMREGGISESDLLVSADLTERRMIVRVQVPSMYVMAERLLANYRDPWTNTNLLPGWTPDRMARHNDAIDRMTGRDKGDPVVFAGLVITNSETGGGAFNIYPQLTVRVCLNGMTITADALRKRHVGAKLDDHGIVKWSDRTLRKNLDLVTSQAADITRRVLSREYVAEKVAGLEAAAGLPIEDPATVITGVSKSLGFTQAEAASILNLFIDGGQRTTGGVMQAVTAASQLIADADRAWDVSRLGVDAMHAAARLVKA